MIKPIPKGKEIEELRNYGNRKNHALLRSTSFLIIIILSTTFSLSAWAQEEANFPPLPDSNENELLYTFYLMDDAGDDTINSMPAIQSMGKKINSGDPNKSGVIYLGDNIYTSGLHKKSSKYRAEDEIRMNAQLDIVKDWDGDVFVIPGNHDWNHYRKGGLKAIKRQGKYVNKYLDRKDAFLPKNGCPGPEVVKLAPGLVMLVIDSQWWVHKHNRSSGNKDDCECRNEDELLDLMKDLLKKYRNQNVIVAAHHPLISNGEHGGHYTFQDHLFPLTKVVDWLYMPLPGLGSIYPFYRKFIGHHQDAAHPHYHKYIKGLSKLMHEYDNMVYVAGHEHNLQFHEHKTVHHIISGAGSKVTKLVPTKKMEFGAAERGYSRLLYYKNGDVWVEYFTVDNATRTDKLAFRKKLYNKVVQKSGFGDDVIKLSYVGKTATVIPDTNFRASSTKRFFFGELNRKTWTSPLEVPYLDIHYEAGGLTPVKKGGGMQTYSLRLTGADGKRYVLRQIKKNPSLLIERGLRGTVTQDILYDGMVASHPYGSVAVPPLADAAGVYHSNPKLVYVPDDPVLGDYQQEFGGTFCLFEMAPDKDMSDYPNFGSTKKVVSYPKAIDKLQEKQNHIVDKEYTIRTRLLDILMADWDRHDDQWKWATFKEDGKVIYRPIPRDRDQVFFEFDGFIMWWMQRKWALRRFQSFDTDIRDIAGTCFNARYFDRSFLTEASRQDWINAAKELKTKITDEVIETAIHQLPKEAFEISGERIISMLKGRRDNLEIFAKRYYDILATSVNVVGTLEDDFIEIERNDDGSVEISMYPRSKKGKRKKEERFYQRVFYPDETEELILYGLDGNDEYQLKGKTNISIVVRIVGGSDKDLIKNKSNVRGLRNYTKIYDTTGKNKIKGGKDTKVKLVGKRDAYDYDREDFKYNLWMPQASLGFNSTDGFFLGPGVKYTEYGFKKSPYKFYHKLLANYSFKPGGFNIYYDFDYIEALGKFDITGGVQMRHPDIYSFYPMSYSSTESDVEMNDYSYHLALKLSDDDQAHSLNLGLEFRTVMFEDMPDFLPATWETKDQDYISPSLEYKYKNLSSKINPNRGLQFLVEGSWNLSTNTDNVDYFNLRSELGIFFPINFSNKQTTLALRSGFSGTYGDHAFYQANFIDGFKTFRGVERNRYSAESFFYQNIEIRQSLLKVKTYVAPFDIGILGHFDVVHTWETYDSEWNKSFGGGVFFSVLEYFMIQGTYSISDKDELLTVGTSFLF